MYQITGDEQYLSFVREYMDFHINHDGSIRGYRRDTFNLDNINNGKLLFGMCDLSGEIHLMDTCRVAGLGPADNPRRDGSVAYYLSEPKQVDDAKGIGAFIMAYSEYLKVIPS